MREIFTDRNYIQSKILILAKLVLIVSVIIFFLPLVILPFFNHAFADDYFCGYNLNAKGFVHYQTFIYINWGGRFAATFTGSLFAWQNFLYNHYYLHSLLLLVLNFFSVLLLFHTTDKFILKTNSSFSNKLLCSFLFLALVICCLPECATYIFWFSSAVTYQIPIVFIQTEIALFILLFNSNDKSLRNFCAVTIPFIILSTIGFNELFVIIQFFLFAVLFYFKLYKKLSKSFIAFVVIAFLTASALLLFAPGNKLRMHEIASKSITTGAVAIAYESFETVWNIFKNPYFWFAGFEIMFFADQTKERWQNYLNAKTSAEKKWLYLILVFIFLLASVAAPVIALKGGIIPERYLNATVSFMLLLLVVLFFIARVSIQPKTLFSTNSTAKIIMYFFFSIGLLCNNYITDAYKSLIIAPIYNSILNEREAALKQAAATNKIAVVNDYNTALSKIINTKYKDAPVSLLQILEQRPPLLFFEDDLANKYSLDVLKKYYGLDSIIVKKN